MVVARTDLGQQPFSRSAADQVAAAIAQAFPASVSSAPASRRPARPALAVLAQGVGRGLASLFAEPASQS